MLEILEVHQRFGDVVALDGVSFQVAPGELVGFVGRNGAGKTTTMRAILGILVPDRGAVRWHGAELDRRVRRRIGYLPEERGLFPKMAVLEQVRFLGRLSGMTDADAEREAAVWIERVGLADRAGDPLGELSLGNQQRVQLAAAMICDPALVVLDEPFSGLDPIGVEVLAEVLRDRAAGGSAVLFSSHQLDLVERLCDRVVVIEAGSIVADGPVDGGLRERFLALAGRGADGSLAAVAAGSPIEAAR